MGTHCITMLLLPIQIKYFNKCTICFMRIKAIISIIRVKSEKSVAITDHEIIGLDIDVLIANLIRVDLSIAWKFSGVFEDFLCHSLF